MIHSKCVKPNKFQCPNPFLKLMEDANIQRAIRRWLLDLGFQAVVSLSLSLAALVNGASAHPKAGQHPK